MNDEYGKQPEEIIQPPEIVEYPETVTYAEVAEEPEENKEYSEISSPSEASVKTVKEMKKSSKIKSVLKGASAVVATVAFVAVIAPDLFSSDSTKISFSNLEIRDTYVKYSIAFDDWSGKDYDVVLYNDYTNRTVEVGADTFTEYEETDGEKVLITEFSHKEKDLKSGVSYTLAVKSGYKTLASTSFTTLVADELPVTKLNGVEAACACGVNEDVVGGSGDGTFHFILDFVDENNWWRDFVATLKDENGTISTCTFTENLHELQTIPVTGVLDGTTATLRISCTSDEYVEYDGDPVEVVLYDQEVEI